MSVSDQSSYDRFTVGFGAIPAEPVCPPPVIPDHELLRRVGHGSYGEVWLARSALGSLRAVKIVYRRSFDHDKPYEREFEGLKKFEPISHARESQIDVFHVGRNEQAGFFYYIMELADRAEPRLVQANSFLANGEPRSTPSEPESLVPKSKIGQEVPDAGTYEPRTLKHDLRTRGALPVAECVQLALSLTRALEHLHSHGLVHRDIKPSNIVFVNGVPKLADIGLVTSVDATRSFVGTDGYIPPEGPGTPQSDLYSLGKVLYECATGKDRLDFPELPSDWRTRADFDQLLEFNEILTKSCDNDPLQRYQSAAVMLAELESLRAGESVKRQRLWQRNLNRTKKLALALTSFTAVTVIVYSLAPRQSAPSTFEKSPIPEANEEYHLGLTELHTALNVKEAVKHFEKATQLDPNFADAYAQMADAWFSTSEGDSVRSGRKAAEKAVSLDPQSGLAHVFFAASKVFILDFPTAERENELAVKLSPNSEEVLLASALIFSNLGRTNDALANLERARSLGQDTPSKLRELFSEYVYGYCREYDRAIAVCNDMSWLDGGKRKGELAYNYLEKGDYISSMRLERESELEYGREAKRVNAEFDALEKAFKEGGPSQYWRKRLEIETPRSGGNHWMQMAAIHARLNQRADALGYLRRAMQESPANLTQDIYTDPSFDTLRDERGFKDLEKELWKKR